jgi:hypothetical protein
MPPSPPSPFGPADAGKYWEGTVTFDVLVRYQGRDSTPPPNKVADAVKKARADKGFSSVNGRRLQTATQPVVEVTAVVKVVKALTAGRYQETFAVTVTAFAPMLQAISMAVSEIDFWDKFNEYVKEGYKGVRNCYDLVTLNRVTSGCSEVLGGAEYTLDDEQKTVRVVPLVVETPGGIPEIGTPESAQTAADSDIPGWAIFLIILIFLCVLWPFLCWYWAKLKFGAGKERIWLQLMFSHSNPALPLLYKPDEHREQLRKQLYNQPEKPAELHEESTKGSV